MRYRRFFQMGVRYFSFIIFSALVSVAYAQSDKSVTVFPVSRDEGIAAVLTAGMSPEGESPTGFSKGHIQFLVVQENPVYKSNSVRGHLVGRKGIEVEGISFRPDLRNQIAFSSNG